MRQLMINNVNDDESVIKKWSLTISKNVALSFIIKLTEYCNNC